MSALLNGCFWLWLPLTSDGFRPILLKKSAMIATAEKYASELEIFALSRGFPASDFA
jgi:hypothetical protein